MDEIWKDIPGFEKIYQISNYGNVKRLARYGKAGRHENAFFKEKTMKQQLDNNGYMRVSLTNDKKKYKGSIHQLIMLSFNGLKSNRKEVIDHIDNNKLNNNINNLQLISARDNVNKHYKTIDNSSKYTGVSWHKRDKKWCCNTTIKGEKIHIGYFKEEHEAHLAFVEFNKSLIDVTGPEGLKIKV